MLSGPPGIGKTTLATLTAREMDFDVLELNASDTRNKKQLDCMLLEAVSSRAIALGQGRALRQRLVIMDEVCNLPLSLLLSLMPSLISNG